MLDRYIRREIPLPGCRALNLVLGSFIDFLTGPVALLAMNESPKSMRPLLLAVITGSILILSSGSSFAQSPPQEHLLGIYAQIVVQDSSGNLVAYLETSRVTIVNTVRLNQLIDQNMAQFQASQISVAGQDLQMLKATESIVHSSPVIVSQNLISVKTSNGVEALVYADHDGYPVAPGDKVTTYWTIIRALS